MICIFLCTSQNNKKLSQTDSMQCTVFDAKQQALVWLYMQQPALPLANKWGMWLCWKEPDSLELVFLSRFCMDLLKACWVCCLYTVYLHILSPKWVFWAADWWYCCSSALSWGFTCESAAFACPQHFKLHVYLLLAVPFLTHEIILVKETCEIVKGDYLSSHPRQITEALIYLLAVCVFFGTSWKVFHWSHIYTSNIKKKNNVMSNH